MIQKFIIILSLLTYSCGMFHEQLKQPQMIDVTSFEKRSFDDVNLRKFIAKSGYSDFKKWHFEELYLAAIYFNPRMEVVKKELQLAWADEITAAQIPNPIITLVPGADNSSHHQPFMPSNLYIPIQTNGKRGLTKNISKYRSLAAQSKVEKVKWDIRKEILTYFINLYFAQQKKQAYYDNIVTQKAIIKIYDQQLKNGQLLTNIASKANVVDLETQIQLQDAQTSEDKNLAGLATTIAVPLVAMKQIKIDFSDLDKILHSDSDFEKLRAKAIMQNPELVAALMEYNATHEALKLEIAKRIPDFNIGPAYQWDAHDGGKIGLGISFQLPIFNQNEGPIAQAKAKRDIAVANFNMLQTQVISAIETAKISLDTAKQKYALAKKLYDEEKARMQNLKMQLGNSKLAELPMLHALSESQITHQKVMDGGIRHICVKICGFIM